MIAILEPTTGKNSLSVCHLRVVLVGTDPPIWRQLQVPINANLGWLHAVLQVAMGWTNSHLHQFTVNGQLYSDTRHYSAEFEGDPEILEEKGFTLEQIVPHETDTFEYEYDLGDSWNHEITVENILSSDAAGAGKAICMDGKRACPPEDCGGVWGYESLLEILKNRKHPEHKSMKAWLGRPFDAEGFDVAKANTWLRKLKWPRVTESQLRKVLMARDDYHE